jgi:hypothetical protein
MTQRQRLENARQGLMHVHRALVEAERIRYERAHGRVDGSGALLQLVIHDPWFAWLRPISELIVQIDEWLDDDQPSAGAPDLAEILLAQVRDRMRPNEAGPEFQQRYHRLLQDDPSVAVAHAEARKQFDA